MRDGRLATGLATLKSVLAAFGMARRRTSELSAAWVAWERGEIELARMLARDALTAHGASDEANHLLYLTAFVAGDYRAALEHHGAIDRSYRHLAELDESVIDAFVHLGALDEALDFARRRKRAPRVTVQRLEEHLVRSLKVHLSGIAIVPFAEHPLTEYFPGFDAEINGQPLTAHVDTGGAFLHMGPRRAAALGIKTIKSERAAHI